MSQGIIRGSMCLDLWLDLSAAEVPSFVIANCFISKGTGATNNKVYLPLMQPIQYQDQNL